MSEFLPGFEINSWGGVCGPAGIAPELVARIGQVGRQAVESPEVRRRYEEGGATVWWTTPEGLADFRRENQARFAPLIRAAGAVVE
jgi:tripartite-type tricarboxylate transporter receptor subunit TctC